MKYHVQYIADEVIGRLRECFPSDIESFQNSPCARTNNEDDPIELAHEDSIAVMVLARAYDLPFLIPAALYHCCCQCSASKILKGASYGRESVYLSPHDLELYIEGRSVLTVANVKRLTFLARSADCIDRAACKSVLYPVAFNAVTSSAFTAPTVFGDLDNWVETKLKICFACKESIKSRLRLDRHKMWTGLEILSGVKPWPPQEQ